MIDMTKLKFVEVMNNIKHANLTDAVDAYVSNTGCKPYVMSIYYNGVQVGTVDIDRLVAEINRDRAMQAGTNGHPRQY